MRSVLPAKATRRPKVKPPAGVRIPLRRLDDGWAFTDDSAMSWYELPGTRWSFLSNEQRQANLTQTATAWAALAGSTAQDVTRAHLRLTTRPYDQRRWARDFDAHARRFSTPDDEQAWARHLIYAQQSMQQLNLAETRVYLGIDIAPRTLWDRVATKAGSTKERRRLEHARAQVERALAMPGLDASTVHPADLEWLVHRSVGLHLPARTSPAAGAPMDFTDMATFTDGVQAEEVKDGTCVRLSTRCAGPKVVRYVAVLSLGRCQELNTPGAHQPWMAYARQLPFPVEISAHIEILTGEQALASVESRLDANRDNVGQLRRNGFDVRPQQEIVEAKALATRHQLEEGDPLAATRIVGQVRFAVAADSEEELQDRILKLQTHYRQYRMEIVHPRWQRALLEEFVPGSRAVTPAHTRHLQLPFWCAAVPTFDSEIGSKVGYPFGRTGGASRKPMMWDPWEALYADQTGLCPLIGELGSGKSFLMGAVVHDAVTRGIRSTVLDPSGTLARLTLIPALAPYSEHLDLLRAPAGTLNPWTVIPSPREQDHADRNEWALALAEAAEERKVLAKDVILMLLPATYRSVNLTTVLVTQAVHSVGGDYNRSLGEVIEALRRIDTPGYVEHAHALVVELSALASAPLARLFYASTDDRQDRALRTDARLLVMTMAGLTLPVLGTDPSSWTTEERLALPLMHLAAQLAVKRAYGGERETPKLLALDEAHLFGEWQAGRALFTRLGRDSRKWRLRVLAASQMPKDVLGQTVGGLTNECFIGRIESPEAQVEALKMLRVPQGVGYEQIIGGLSAPAAGGRRRVGRQFLFRDAAGRVERFTVDTSADADLTLALSTERRIPDEWLVRRGEVAA